MGQSGKVPSDKAATPFSSSDGKPTNQGTGASGGHDFLTSPKGSGPASGGRDFTKESRPQSEAKPEVVPNPQEIPAGGKILKADPSALSKKVSGTAQGPSERNPFKGMR